MSEKDYAKISETITIFNLMKTFGGLPSEWNEEDYGACLRLLTVEGIIQRATQRARKKAQAKAKSKGARRGGKLSRK